MPDYGVRPSRKLAYLKCSLNDLEGICPATSRDSERIPPTIWIATRAVDPQFGLTFRRATQAGTHDNLASNTCMRQTAH